MIQFYKSRLLNDYSLIEKLEKEFAEYVGSKYAVAVDSCTNGLFLSLAYERRDGRKVIEVPTMTFVSVANSVLQADHELVLTDKCYVGKAYRLYGSDVVDSAHEVTRGQMRQYCRLTKVVFSFYPTKLVPSYQGGMICTDDKDFVEWARVARQCGRTGYGASYDVPIIGYKMNMTPIQAKEALKSLHILDSVKAKQKTIRNLYNKYLTPVVDTDHLYCIRKKEWVPGMGRWFSKHFKPIHQMTAYKCLDDGQFTYTDGLSSEILSLPLHPYLSLRDAKKVLEVLK